MLKRGSRLRKLLCGLNGHDFHWPKADPTDPTVLFSECQLRCGEVIRVPLGDLKGPLVLYPQADARVSMDEETWHRRRWPKFRRSA